MSKLGIAITAAICLPLGALLAHQASAQVVLHNALVDASHGETHFERAQDALREAQGQILASERAHEDMWRDAGHHAGRARDAIEQAQRATDEVANWVGVDGTSQPLRMHRFFVTR